MAYFKNLTRGHTHNENDRFHRSVFDTLDGVTRMTPAEMVNEIAQSELGTRAKDGCNVSQVYVQRIFDFEAIADKFIIGPKYLFNKSRPGFVQLTAVNRDDPARRNVLLKAKWNESDGTELAGMWMFWTSS